MALAQTRGGWFPVPQVQVIAEDVQNPTLRAIGVLKSLGGYIPVPTETIRSKNHRRRSDGVRPLPTLHLLLQNPLSDLRSRTRRCIHYTFTFVDGVLTVTVSAPEASAGNPLVTGAMRPVMRYLVLRHNASRLNLVIRQPAINLRALPSNLSPGGSGPTLRIWDDASRGE